MSIYSKTKVLFSIFLLIGLISFSLLISQPVQAVEKTLATQKSQFGFTMNIPDLRNPTKAYQDLEIFNQSLNERSNSTKDSSVESIWHHHCEE